MKRYLLLAAALGLTAAGVLWFRERQAAGRLAAWQAEVDQDALDPVLLKEFDWERADLALAEFVELLAAKTALRVELDEPSIVSSVRWRQPPRERKVHIPQGRYSLDSLLPMVLAGDSLCGELQGRSLVITALVNSKQFTRLRTTVYPLPLPEPAGLGAETWSAIIAANIEGHVETVPGALVVVTNAAGHRRVRLVIDAMCHLDEEPEDTLFIPPHSSAAKNRILAVLDQPASIELVEMPLVGVARYLSNRYDVPVILRADQLAAAGISIDTPVSKSLSGISLRSALGLLLRDLELTFVVGDGLIFITTPEEAQSHQFVTAYPIQDLLSAGSDDEVQALKTAVASLVPLWTSQGWLDVIDGRHLVVVHNQQAQEEVVAALTKLRTALADETDGTPAVILYERSEKKLRDALHRPLGIDFQGQPLKDVVLFLQEQLSIPVLLCVKKLEEAGISPDTPLTLKLPPQPADAVLVAVLTPLELTFLIRDEVLQITTPEDADGQRPTRIFDVRRLLNESLTDVQLIDVLKRTITGLSPERGYPDTVVCFRGILMVQANQSALEETEALIRDPQELRRLADEPARQKSNRTRPRMIRP